MINCAAPARHSGLDSHGRALALGPRSRGSSPRPRTSQHGESFARPRAQGDVIGAVKGSANCSEDAEAERIRRAGARPRRLAPGLTSRGSAHAKHAGLNCRACVAPGRRSARGGQAEAESARPARARPRPWRSLGVRVFHNLYRTSFTALRYTLALSIGDACRPFSPKQLT